MPTGTTPVQAPGDPTEMLPKKLAHARPLFDREILRRAIGDSFAKLNPATLFKNPVIFVSSWSKPALW